MNGGSADVLFEIKNLAVPFALILAKNGMDYLKKRGPVPAPKKGGGCSCGSNSTNRVTLGGHKKGGSSCGMASVPPTTGGRKGMGGSSCSSASMKSLDGGAAMAQELNSLTSRLNSLVDKYSH